MSKRSSRDQHDLGLFVRELRLSLRNNAGAYGYSVMITCALAMLGAIHRSPDVGQIFLFVLGAVASFALIETVATRTFTRALDDEATKVIALGSSLNLISIASAIGVAALAGSVLPTALAWVGGAFVASATYLLVGAVEMSVARRIEEARNLE